jgi:hypothetical protein
MVVKASIFFRFAARRVADLHLDPTKIFDACGQACLLAQAMLEFRA